MFAISNAGANECLRIYMCVCQNISKQLHEYAISGWNAGFTRPHKFGVDTVMVINTNLTQPSNTDMEEFKISFIWSLSNYSLSCSLSHYTDSRLVSGCYCDNYLLCVLTGAIFRCLCCLLLCCLPITPWFSVPLIFFPSLLFFYFI